MKHKTKEEIHNEKETKLLILLGVVGVIFLLLVAGILIFRTDKKVKTIEELHKENLAGTLNPSEGYLYNGYSFVKFGGMWYTQAQLENTLYDLAFNYGPKETANISIEGTLRNGFFNEKKIWITFNPEGHNLKYIAVANGGLSLSLIKAFGFNLSAGCTSHEEVGCQKKEIINCDSEDDKNKSIIYFKDDEPTKIIFNDNCVTIQGKGEEIVKAKDRLLMKWYKLI